MAFFASRLRPRLASGVLAGAEVAVFCTDTKVTSTSDDFQF